MKYKELTSYFSALNPRHIIMVHIAHMYACIVSDHIGDPSYDFKHTYMNIFITKTQHTPNIYKPTYPTYESFGASDRDMTRGTTLVSG